MNTADSSVDNPQPGNPNPANSQSPSRAPARTRRFSSRPRGNNRRPPQKRRPLTGAHAGPASHAEETPSSAAKTPHVEPESRMEEREERSSHDEHERHDEGERIETGSHEHASDRGQEEQIERFSAHEEHTSGFFAAPPQDETGGSGEVNEQSSPEQQATDQPAAESRSGHAPQHPQARGHQEHRHGHRSEGQQPSHQQQNRGRGDNRNFRGQNRDQRGGRDQSRGPRPQHEHREHGSQQSRDQRDNRGGQYRDQRPQRDDNREGRGHEGRDQQHRAESLPAERELPPPPPDVAPEDYTLDLAIRKVQHIRETLELVLEEMEEVMGTLNKAESEKEGDERQIQELRRVIAQLQRRSGNRPAE